MIDIVKELETYEIYPVISDPQADLSEEQKLQGVKFVDMENISNMDAVILAVAHKEFRELTLDKLNKLYKDENRILFDIKGILDCKQYEEAGYTYWRL